MSKTVTLGYKTQILGAVEIGKNNKWEGKSHSVAAKCLVYKMVE